MPSRQFYIQQASLSGAQDIIPWMISNRGMGNALKCATIDGRNLPDELFKAIRAAYRRIVIEYGQPQ